MIKDAKSAKREGISKPQFDLTPEICYQEGRAVQVREFFNCNNVARGSSDYGLNEFGQYWEFHNDPDHGGGPRQQIPRSQLEKLAAGNPNDFPVLDILGETENKVHALLIKMKFKAREFEYVVERIPLGVYKP